MPFDNTKRRSSALAIQKFVRSNSEKNKQIKKAAEQAATKRRYSAVLIQAVVRKSTANKKKSKKRGGVSPTNTNTNTNANTTTKTAVNTPSPNNGIKRQHSAGLIQNAWKSKKNKKSSSSSSSSSRAIPVLEANFSIKPSMREKSMPPKHTCLGSSPSNNGGPTQILKHLWLGNREDAMNYDKLKKLSISVVVNATEQLPNFHPDQMKYMKINIKDKETTDLRPHFAGVTQFIANAIDNGESVLVHCVAGASRSASFVICYMMSKLGEQISLLDAFRWCKARRSCVQPNKMFLVQLAEIEIYFHNGCSSVAKRKEKLWTSFEMNELRREKVKGHLKSGMNVSLSPCVIM